jgi:uncharacterized protein YecE (DUF72 family)
VDSTYYRTPSHQTVEGWRDRTPETFGFSLKTPRVITHEKVLVECQAEVDAFVRAARLLGPRLLCCLLQFGYFNRGKLPSLKAFLQRLDPFLASWPEDVPVAVEVRNKTWMTPDLGDCLRAHRAAWVLPDQAWMPSPLSMVQKMDMVTGPFAYVRLLGDREEVDRRTKVLNQVVVDRSDQIQADADAVRLLSARVPVLVFVNNHYAGYAHETVRQMEKALGVVPGIGEQTC